MTTPTLTTLRELSSLNTTGGTTDTLFPTTRMSRPRTRAAGLNGVDTRWGNASGPSKRGDHPTSVNHVCTVATPYPLRTCPVPATSLLVSAVRSTLDDLGSSANPGRCVIEPFDRGRTTPPPSTSHGLSAPRIPVADLSPRAHLSNSVSDPHKDRDRHSDANLLTGVPIPHHASDLARVDTRAIYVAGLFTVADLGFFATRRTTVGNPSFAGDRIRTAALLSDVPGTTNPASDQKSIAPRSTNVACPF